MSRFARIFAITITVLLALVMASAGLQKLTGSEAMVDLFYDIGAGQWLRYVVGVLELSAALGLIAPRLRALAALGVVLLMTGATITNVFIISENTTSTVVLGLIAGLIVWIRRDELRFGRGSAHA
jgi:putative oxidoreductase